jgi:hypothetical protein
MPDLSERVVTIPRANLHGSYCYLDEWDGQLRVGPSSGQQRKAWLLVNGVADAGSGRTWAWTGRW